jgi:hypothetical protein
MLGEGSWWEGRGDEPVEKGECRDEENCRWWSGWESSVSRVKLKIAQITFIPKTVISTQQTHPPIFTITIHINPTLHTHILTVPQPINKVDEPELNIGATDYKHFKAKLSIRIHTGELVAGVFAWVVQDAKRVAVEGE